MKKVFNIEREVELLSTGAKRAWKNVMAQIDAFAKKENLTEKEKNALIQRQFAAAKYADLKADNEYNARSSDELAKRKIERNKKEMKKLESIYEAYYEDVKDFESRFNRSFDKSSSQEAKKRGK